MDSKWIYDEKKEKLAFAGYDEYMEYLFACVNEGLNRYLTVLKAMYAVEQGGYKNVLYPDLEIAHDTCLEKLAKFRNGSPETKKGGQEEEAPQMDAFSAELDDIFRDFIEENYDLRQEGGSTGTPNRSMEEMIVHIQERAQASREQGISLPFYEICRKQDFDSFTVFCFACGILSSTQTDYAGVFQVINENSSLPAPTIESAAKIYYGSGFSITGAYGDMSVCLEQLLPMLDLKVNSAMPFSTAVSPDKRIIDYLFGRNPLRLDENYIRFFKMLTGSEELDPIMANSGVLEAMEISHQEGVRIFSYYGDEGSGRKFFVKHFCKKNALQAISINCKKLFVYDFNFVEKALWAVTRECILTDACCVLDELSYREDEKEKFFGYMDLAFSKLVRHGLLVFAISREKLTLKDMTGEEFTELELPTPTNQEREKCWRHFAQD